MNINMLRDTDDDAGFYVAVCSAKAADLSWPGCTLFASADGGVTYASVQTIGVQASMGVTRSVLGDFEGGNIVDELSRLNLALIQGTLSSTTNDGLLAGVNAAVVGDEILYFRDATLESDGSYTLSGFLRGRRGSEYAMGAHEVGERFVLANIATLSRVAQSTADIGIPKQYKAVTSGMSIADSTERDFTNLGVGLMPYATVQLGGGRDSSGNATLTWVRRNRKSGEWRNSVDVPNSEASEAYEVEIWDSGYSNLTRTIAGLSSPTATYSAADQTTDFGSPQSTVYFRVYQLSAIVGRGHAADGSI